MSKVPKGGFRAVEIHLPIDPDLSSPFNPSSRIDPLWNTNLVAVLRGAAQAPKAVIPPYSWSVRCPRSMRLVYISLVMFFGSVASQQLYATKIWYLNMLCQHVAGHVEAATHPGHTVLFASGLV